MFMFTWVTHEGQCSDGSEMSILWLFESYNEIYLLSII